MKIIDYMEILPIIYIETLDFDNADNSIKKISDELKYEVIEWNDGLGYVDFETKNKDEEDYSLDEFLELVIESNENYSVVLKDIHHHLENPKIISLIKTIAQNKINRKTEHIIFIVSSKRKIPIELEKLITIYELPKPTQSEIKKLIQNFDENIDKQLLEELSVLLKGFMEFEIEQILNMAFYENGEITENDKNFILEKKEQIIKKTGLVELLNFKETINDIGGLENLKEWLNKKAKIFNNLQKAKDYGVETPKGIMIVGMPGCGKSLTAKASSHIFNVPLLKLDIGRLFGKYVGESEDNMRKAIEIAEAVSPCILWIDELEKAFAGVGESDVTTRLFGYFLTWMQDKTAPVFVVATANDISKLPPEFLRKGRFDEIFFVDFPNETERKQILNIHLKKRKQQTSKIEFKTLINKTKGYSGADIEAIIKESVESGFLEDLKELETKHILDIISKTKPISESLKDSIENLKNKLKNFDIKKASK